MDLREQAAIVARQHGIPEGIFFGLIEAESNWNPGARSSSGAIGLTQVMPSTARAMGFEPARLAADPLLQLEAGARYLKEMFELFLDWESALAAYNAGPHNVKKYGGVPPFPVTKKYIKKVLIYAKEHEGKQSGSSFPEQNS
ncbi:MAG: lytic transglycosylase domain-containing protein [Firmicutes bacterium]|jgi:soluble lytic murein transglycosylase-like protein|nr:lytic transglycosylase domain-containing protein [Bacillota bacterium]